MRIVVWNCWRGVAGDRWEALRSLAPDIAVLPEAGAKIDLPSGATPPTSVLWSGQRPRKGLAVMSFGGWHLDPIAGSPQVPWVLPATVRGPFEFTLLAIWTVLRDGWPGYAGQVAAAIEGYRDELSSGRAVLAGDFNCSPQTADPTPHLRNVTALGELGMENAYHLAENLEHGAESVGTLYWRWQRDRPYHCDLAFIPRRWEESIRSVRIEDYEEWVERKVSDHVPVVVDLALP